MRVQGKTWGKVQKVRRAVTMLSNWETPTLKVQAEEKKPMKEEKELDSVLQNSRA